MKPAKRRWGARVVLPLAFVAAACVGETAIGHPPVADFTHSPTTPKPGETVTFTTQSSRQAGDNAYSKTDRWDLDNDGQFDDGTTTDGGSQTVSRSFPAAGDHVVRMETTLTQPGVGTHGTAVATKTVQVREPAPPPPPPEQPPPQAGTAAIAGPDRLVWGQPARFVAQAPGATRHEWDLNGDGQYETDTGTGAAAEAPFDTPGTHSIGLRATFSNGTTATASKSVVVTRPPIAGLAFSPANPKPGQRIKFELKHLAEEGTKFNVFAWRFGGVKPAARSVRLPRPKELRSSATRESAGAQPEAIVELAGAQPTLVPKLQRSLPKGTHRIDTSSMDTTGAITTLHGAVGVGGGVPGPRKRGYSGEEIDCTEEDYDGFCSAIQVVGQPATKVKSVFRDATPGFEVCLPRNIRANRVFRLAKFDAVQQISYPSEEGFAQGGIAASFRRGGEPVRPALDVQDDCRVYKAKPIEWTMGDGTKFGAGPLGFTPSIVRHEYVKTGTYTVSLLADVPYARAKANLPDKQVADPHDAYDVKYFPARMSIQIEVLEADCAPQKLRGIPVTTVLQSGAVDDQRAQGCFVVRKALDGLTTTRLYEPFPGFDIDLNRVRLKTLAEPHETVVPPPVMDPKKNRIVAPPGRVVVGEFADGLPAGETRRVFGFNTHLDIPKPKSETLEINGEKRTESLATLPPLPGAGTELGGLKILTTEALLSPAHGAYARFSMDMPPPLGEQTPPLVLGGVQPSTLSAPKLRGAQSTAADDADVDFSIDMSGVDLGLLRLGEGTFIKHRRKGGWFGGGNIEVPTFGVEFKAPYKRPPEGAGSVRCLGEDGEPDGPSGISLDEDGDFEFGGIALKLGIPIPPYATFECISLAGSTQPFYIVGKVGLTVPAAAPLLDLDGCFGLAILLNGESAPMCNKRHTASELDPGDKLTWFRAAAELSLHKPKINLAAAYFDLQRSSSKTIVQAGGGIGRLNDFGLLSPIHVGPFSLLVKVDGTLIFQSKEPEFQFDFGGKGEICGPTPAEVLSFGLVDSDLCVGAEGRVSSRGAGFCATPFQAKFRDGFKFEVVTSCNMDDLKIAPSRLYVPFRRGPSTPLLGAAMTQEVKVPAGLREVGFRITGEGGPPRPTVTGPGGFKAVSNGTWFHREPGWHITRLAQDDGPTFVVIQNPRPGTYRVEAAPDTPPITSIALNRPLREPRVLARITKRGGRRRLVYRAELDRGDKLRFMETGRFVARQLGTGRNGTGSINFDPGTGSPGKRVITAYIDRGETTYKDYTVATYSVPRARPVQQPLVKARRAKGDRLVVSTAPTAGVRGFELTATLADGRVLKLATRGSSVTIPDVPPGTDVRLDLIPLSGDGRRGRAVRVKAGGKRAKPARVRL